ncbi:MAG: hypothetical protein JNL60_01140 [Bacteroidia bacterium]|nr:hypothetical protein [Bacteroidia bacterium]
MKTSIILSKLFLIVFIAAAHMLSAGGHKLKYDSLSCLQIEGKVLNAGDNEDVCIIELIDGTNTVVDTLILKEGKNKFAFVLQKNDYYSIRISKNGFISKLVAINTEILTQQDGIHKFNFETRLLSSVIAKKLNEDVLDFPVAIIHFDYENNCFDYNKEYTEHIKRELYAKVTRPEPKKDKSKKIEPVLDSAPYGAYAAN